MELKPMQRSENHGNHSNMGTKIKRSERVVLVFVWVFFIVVVVVFVSVLQV